MRHPSVLFAPSSLRSFLLRKRQADNALVHLRYAPHRHHRPSPHQPLDLIGVSASRESGAVVCAEIRKRNFHAHGSDFTAHRGRSVGAFCIFREGERGRGQNERQRGGGCAKPLRGQAPVTPKRLLHSRFASATRYKLEDFVAGTLADAPNLPVSQIFTLDFHGTHRA